VADGFRPAPGRPALKQRLGRSGLAEARRGRRRMGVVIDILTVAIGAYPDREDSSGISFSPPRHPERSRPKGGHSPRDLVFIAEATEYRSLHCASLRRGSGRDDGVYWSNNDRPTYDGRQATSSPARPRPDSYCRSWRPHGAERSSAMNVGAAVGVGAVTARR